VSHHELEVFFDGDCPLCTREIALLRSLDRAGRIGFVDIADADFDAAALGVEFSALMDTIHGRLPNGALIEGVEVFRRLYAAVGLGWLVAPTRWPGISHALELAYRVFAEHRLRLTGRCADGACAIPEAEAPRSSEPSLPPAPALHRWAPAGAAAPTGASR